MTEEQNEEGRSSITLGTGSTGSIKVYFEFKDTKDPAEIQEDDERCIRLVRRTVGLFNYLQTINPLPQKTK